MNALPDTLEQMYKIGYSTNQRAEKVKFDDSISRDEALAIGNVLRDIRAEITLETGVASGASTLVICQHHKLSGQYGAMHYGIDPNQISQYGGAALENLKKESMQQYFQLLEGPSHLKIAELIQRGISVDFALIDGWHTFDYTLIDFFLIDKLLRKGGIVAFHDMYGPAKQKVLRFIKTHRKYESADDYLVKGNESFKTTIKFFIWRIFKNPKLIFSSYHWKYQIKNSSGLLFLRKTDEFEPPYNFYKSF
jgi:predicted O-methyltransferase YrrM